VATKSINMTEITREIETKIGVKPNLAKNVIKALIEVAEDEIAKGKVFSIPGFVKLSHGYKPALKKGREVRDPSTGEIHKAAEGKPAEITVKARALAKVKKAAPSPTSKAGKPIAEEGKARAAAAAERKKQREAEAAAAEATGA
jgi:nucleoid DNA-binding protein